MRVFYKCIIISLLFLSCIEMGSAGAPPQYFIVRGKLIDASLQPKQGAYDIRVSLWFGADANDAMPTHIEGNLWERVYRVSLEKDGRFEVKVGERERLPMFFSFDDYKYMQLDAKSSTESVYKILDPIRTNDKVDRLDLLTIPFKSTLDDFVGRALGYSAGNIPFLNKQGRLPASVLPAAIETTLMSLSQQVQNISDQMKTSSWQSPVQGIEALPVGDEAHVGDVRYVTETEELRVFNGTQWKSTAGKSDGRAFPLTQRKLAELVKLHKNKKAVPGVFYWDVDHKEYYVGMADGSLRALFGEGQLDLFQEEKKKKNQDQRQKRKEEKKQRQQKNGEKQKKRQEHKNNNLEDEWIIT